MQTLQKSFIYSGDFKKAPVKSISLNFKIPVYEYAESNSAGNEPITRKIIGTDSTIIDKDLSSREYTVKLPDNIIIGKDDLNFQKFLLYSVDSKKLDNFSTTIEVEYTVDAVNKIGSKSFEAIYFYKLIPQHLMFNRVNNLEFDTEHLILINKDSYLSLLKRLSKFSPSQDEFYLLEIILKLIDFNTEFPFLLKKIPDEVRIAVLDILKSDNPEAWEIIIRSFPDLFDFPLSIPEIKTVDAAGKFTVLTSDNSIITKNELSYYDLLLEYTINDGKNTYQAIHVDMEKAGDSLQNNSINFSFTDDRKIILTNIQGTLSIKVKGFDGSILWSKQFAPDAPELQELKIEVPLMKPVRLTPLDKKAPPDSNKKIRGQVIAYNKDCSLKDISVIIKAKKDGGETFQIVGSAKTDNSGNFFMPYPFGRYTEAQAIVSLAPDDPVSVPVSNDNENNQTISDDFLFLLVTNADCSPDKEDDCDCHSPKKASRLPDHDDLIKSDEYSQDLGGGCINLSTPNRTLSEYNYQAVVRTSDPDVANYTLTKTTNLSSILSVNEFLAGTSTKSPIDVAFQLTPGPGKIERKPIDLNNIVKWQDDPGDKINLELYQAVTIATGHILHYKSKFKADGYSLGDLLYSLALAPGQKKEIVVFDSTHSLLGSETQQSTQREKLAAAIVNDRTVTDQLGGNLNEAMQGQSTATTSGISAGGGLGFSYGGFGASLGVSGGTSTTDASASQNSARDVSQFFDEKLKQSIMQNSESYRQLNSSVVTTVKENQKYSATTEVVANHNHCHALTILYFEVLRHFAVYQELSSVEECVFVPFLMTNFSPENIYKWRDVIAPRLLPMPSNTYMSVVGFGGGYQHPLLKAFDANERIKSNYAYVDFPSGSYDDERITNITGSIDIRVNIEQPKTLYDRIKTFPLITTQTDFGDFLSHIGDGLFGKTSLTRPDMNDYVKVDPNFTSVPPKDCIRIVKFDAKLFDTTLTRIDTAQWNAYARILNKGSNIVNDIDNIADMLNRYFFGKLISEWDDVFNNRLAPDLFKAIVETIYFKPMKGGKSITGDFSTSAKYNGGERLMKVDFDGQTGLKRNEFEEHITLDSNDATVKSLNILLNVQSIQIYYSTPHYNGPLFYGYSGDDLLDGTTLYIPENTEEKRNPRKEDIFLVNKLIEHLNSNLEYYNKILWYRLDPDRRYMLLDGFGIELYDRAGAKLPNLRSLASVVKNQLITVAGNSLVFPVAAGYKVSNSFIEEAAPNGNPEEVTLFDHYKPLTPVEPYRISVPSRGVFAETLQSYCNACEKIETDRLQDWNKFPNTDEPTPFAPITVPTPTITDWKAAFKDFAPPMVNIQNAPALPTPGAGLAGLSDLLGKSGVFKDITGLDATQQTALKTYLSNQDSAKSYAEMAKELAMQDHNTQHSDKISDSLKQARDSGAISQEEYNKLTKQHLQQQIDGGKSEGEETKSKKQETSPISAAVDLAKTRKGNFSATETTVGGSKTAEFKTINDKGPQYDFTVPGTIVPIKQQTPNACWATVTTMMANWKKKQNQSVNDYITAVGPEYIPFIKTGITIEKLGAFCNTTRLKMASSNTEYPVSFYYDILQKNGPIWVIDLESSDPKMLHGRLLIGIKGDDSSNTTMFTIIDPATGSKYDEALSVFIAKTENVVKTIDAVKDVQIPLLIYYKDAYDKSLYGNTTGGAIIGSGDNQTRVRAFNPVNENTLVVNGEEGPVVANLTNWTGLYKKPDGSFSEDKKTSDRHFQDLVDTSITRYCAGAYRAPEALDKIVLHETAGFGDFKTISQFSVIKFPDVNPTKSFKAMPHFCINKDGSIIQFLDVCELANHGDPINSSSIGIEFVNHPWGQEGLSQDGTVKDGITPLEIPAIPTLPSLNGKGVKTCLYIPSQTQLESLVTLLKALFAHSLLTSLKQTWLNVININPKKIATEKLDDLKAYFIINNATTFLNDAKLRNITPDGWSISSPGVYNHALYAGHTDGMIQSFYTWLRIGQKMNQSDAMTTFKAFIGTGSSRQDAGGSTSLVDVSKIVFQVV
ncbi:N-acetylmuramoyl-L-alanine amidase [Chitinophaga sp. CF118]|uniref:papain-like cysteine protease family protein n=1 Tax=Chitinophaga sp. CF118 TaxID=1884367 RepID=UPI0008F1E5D4|nr:papain-like cysteine protease family protein [Chitinophaga sp. CF118]SFF08517.1 N-acetylmuramoyl-L-alanine amidase [Chitinophaga sp. CF118]